MKSDAELLRDYRRRGDQTAFRLLVERHGGLVQGAALRRTGDPELAREVSQQVFVLLAGNAGRLYEGTGLAGWLHRTAVLVSASVRRREQNRGRIMKRYEHHMLLTSAPGAERWADALPWVDEGLARLRVEDREILMAHFWQGLTYQEIAAARSSTEAAVQRRASRAFEKLSAWLGKRRASVPAGILTAGLGTLAPRASAAASAPVRVPELPRVSSASSWVSVRVWRMREMLSFGRMKFAAAFLMAALLGGAGFGKGRLLAKEVAGEDQARRTLAADTAEAGAALRTLTENTPPPETPVRKPLAEIVAEASRHYRNGADPAGAARGTIMLEEIRPEEVPAALALLGGDLEEEGIGTRMVPQLIQRWKPAVKADGAVTWVLANIRGEQAFSSCLQNAVHTWAAQDAPAARAWWRQRTDIHDRAHGMGVFNAILMAFNPEQRETLWQELPGLAGDELQAAENILSPGVRDPAARQEIFSRISAVPDEHIRASLLRQSGRLLARLDPETAVAWMRNLPLNDPREAFLVRGQIARDLSDRHPVLAARVMLQNPPGPLRDLVMDKLQKHVPSPAR